MSKKPLTQDEVRDRLSRSLEAAQAIAKLTPTKRDDEAVTLLSFIVHDRDCLSAVYAVLAQKGALSLCSDG